MDTAALQTELAQSANEFSAQLQKLVVAINADMSQVVRASVLKVFGNIIKRSPVDTGAYRASHGIANYDPPSTEGIVKGKKGSKISAPNKGNAWKWKVGDGDIFIYNNVPYAERIENGWSVRQAPQGVYRLALAEFTAYMNQELTKYTTFEPMGGE